MDIEYTKNNPLRCFFAFEGYNSQGLALNRLKQNYPDFDWVCVGRSEIDKYAIQAADALFPEDKDKNYGDISKISWSDVPDFDLFTYSFPCTNLSFAGKQEGCEEGSGTASSLLWECRKAIIAKRPKYLLMENVKALVSRKFLPYFLKWQNELASYGYSNFAKVLNSRDFGIPQNRERIFMVSILGDNASFHFPEPFPLERKLKDVLESEVDEKYYLSEKCINGFLAHAERHKNDGFKFNHTDGNVVANTILASSQSRPCDNFIKTVGNLYGDNKQAGRIYDAEGIAPTLDNMASGGNTDCLVFEPKQVIGSTQKCAYRGDVDGVSPTITAACGMGGGQTPMILGVTVNPNRKFEFGAGRLSEEISPTITCQESKNTSIVWERGKHVNYKITDNGKIRAYTDDDRKSGVSEFQIDNEDAIASTVTTAHTPKCYGESMGFRIRKLTPREVLRLMDVDDEDIDKLIASGISNTQLYKMGGNSIVVGVLYHIFRKLFIDKENENQQLTLF